MTSGDPQPTKIASPVVLKTIAFLGYCATLGGAWWILQVVWPGWTYHHFRIWVFLISVPYWIATTTIVEHRYGINLTARPRRSGRRWRYGGNDGAVHCA